MDGQVVSKPTTLYVRDGHTGTDNTQVWPVYRPASRSEVIEALDIDYEAARRTARFWTTTPGRLNDYAVESMVNDILAAALGLEDDE